jgi:hypothetical protein
MRINKLLLTASGSTWEARRLTPDGARAPLISDPEARLNLTALTCARMN